MRSDVVNPVGVWARAAAVLATSLSGVAYVQVGAALSWAAAVLAVDLLGSRGVRNLPGRAGLTTLLVAESLLVAVATWADPALALVVGPLLLVPAYRAGQTRDGTRAVALVAAAVVLALVGVVARGGRPIVGVVDLLPWGVAAAVTGLLAASLARRSHRDSQRSLTPAARRAGLLLRQLDMLADSMAGGFDPPTCAELLLDEVDRRVSSSRRGVLVGYATDRAVPLAIRGSDRAPWPEPSTDESVLGQVWRWEEARSDLVDLDGQSRAMLVVPLGDPAGRRMGVLVLERSGDLPFTDGDREEAVAVAQSHAGNIDVALMFASLRERAGMEERERLAREMHDGVAQELVSFGYQIDVLRRLASKAGWEHAAALDGLRGELTRTLADLRLRIFDLRVAVRADAGLGAVIGDRLQRFGANSGIRVVLRLSESGYRLPVHAETLLYRLVLDVLADARVAEHVTTVDVTLDVDAPNAFLKIYHDGATMLHPDRFAEHPLASMGGRILVEPSATGVVVQLNLRLGATTHATLVSERIPRRG